MRQWNYFRKLWHSWLKARTNLLLMVIGAVAVVVAIVQLVMRQWPEAIGWFFTGVSLLGASIGLLYSAENEPAMTLCNSDSEIKAFMRRFISQGTTVHIASYRLSWVRGDHDMQAFLAKTVEAGKQVVMFAQGPDDFTERLTKVGIRVTAYPANVVDVPRFTLLNLGRAGSERLAVAREGLPNHWIDVYEDKHHPQVIAIARAYIRHVEGNP